jgi:flagella basal body P-ring formation protein FlgA
MTRMRFFRPVRAAALAALAAGIGLVALATAPQPAAAAQLRTDVVVTGSQIRLGDLFAGLEPHESLQAVATAPALGGQVQLAPEWIERVARAYGVDWDPPYRVPVVTIRRADPAEQAAAESAVRAELSRVIEAGTAMPEAPAAVEETPVAAPEPEADGIDVPVLARRLRPGEVIAAGDIAWTTLPASRVDAGIAIDPEELIGMGVRRVLNPDQPVRAADLRAPVVVGRGSAVSMVLETPGLRVTARGRALEDGALGQAIRVVNVDSNRTVDAVVTGPNTVAIVAPAAF